MHKYVLFLAAPLLISCGSDGGHDSQRSAGPGDEAFITAANADILAGETTTIIDMVGVVGNADERLFSASDDSLPCALLGYQGDGTAIIQGRLQQPGDNMNITFNGCTLAGAPLMGRIKVSLVELGQDDMGERFITHYDYQDLMIGSGNNQITLSGVLSVEGHYDYASETMTTTRKSNALQLNQGQMAAAIKGLECIDSYTGLWDTAPFTMECHLRFESTSVGGSVSVVTVEPFQGEGGENRPTSGELQITGANHSKTRLIAQEDGQHVLIQWDEEGDGRYEGQLLRTWEELKGDVLDWTRLLNP